jgi:hypothetical protein
MDKVPKPSNSEEEYSLVGCNAVYFRDIPTFRRNPSSSFSGWKIMPSKKPTDADIKLILAQLAASLTLRP